MFESSHPGACSAADELPIVLFDNLPRTTRIQVTFDNTVAQLGLGEMASCLVSFSGRRSMVADTPSPYQSRLRGETAHSS